MKLGNDMGNIDFRPEIIRRENSYCVFLPEWNLSAEGQSLEEAYQRFEEQKRDHMARKEKFGLAQFTPEPFPQLRRFEIMQELGLFFVKTATFTFAVIFVFILLLPHIGAAVRNQVAPAAMGKLNQWAIDFPTKLNARLDRVTPEERRQMVEQWGRLVNRTAVMKELIQQSKEEKQKAPGSR